MKKWISILLCLSLILGLSACGGAEPSASQASAPAEGSAEAVPETEPQQEEASAAASEEEAASGLQDPEMARQVQAVLDELEFSPEGFLTQQDFYAALEQLLTLQGVALSECTAGNAQFTYSYSNVTDVRLLTMSQTPEQVQEDVAVARKAVDESAGSERPELKLNEDAVMEEAGTVRCSESYVTSFVITASDAQDDQTLLFLTASSALAILDRNYDNTETAFAALRGNLFNLYNNSGGNAVSWIDGIDNSKSFVIPGNAIECWLGLLEDGNYYLAITPYVQYDEIIDVAASGGTSPFG